MNKKIRNLTWKYFLKQKVVEIVWFLLITAIIIFLPYYAGKLMSLIYPPQFSSIYYIWFTGFLYLSISTLSIMIIVFAIKDWLISWIKSNWDKAKARAKKELKS